MLQFIRSVCLILTFATVCGCLLVSGTSVAHAAKLDDAACSALKVERARLETDSIKSDMAKGPQWAKDNLTPERLKEIEQLIGLQESVAFRCALPKPLPAPASLAKAGEGAKQDVSIAPGVGEPTSALTPLPGASPEPSVKPAKKSTVTKKALAPSKPAAKAERAPSTKSTSTKKYKPKVSDVYVPPAKNPGLGFSANTPSVTGKASSLADEASSVIGDAPSVTGEATGGASAAPLSP